MFAEMLRSISLTFCLPHAGVFASKCGDRRRAVDEEETIVLFLPGMVKYVLMSQPPFICFFVLLQTRAEVAAI